MNIVSTVLWIGITATASLGAAAMESDFLKCEMHSIINMKDGKVRRENWIETYRLEFLEESFVKVQRLTVDPRLEGWDGVMDGSVTETSIKAERRYSLDAIGEKYFEDVDFDRLVGSLIRSYVAISPSNEVSTHYLYKGVCAKVGAKF